MKLSVLKTVILTFVVFLLASQAGQAQSTVTFQLNMEPQLKDSVFVPGRDVVKLKGDLYPLTGKGVTLSDTAPKDSIYSVEIRFPGSANGKTISYNFVLETGPKTLNESMPRQLRLRRGSHTLDALYFDSFAW